MAIKLLKPVLVLLPVAALCMFGAVSRPHKKKLNYTTFQTPAGWGYNILVDTTVVIHQEQIPALQTQSGFTNRAQARAAALLVIHKVLAHQVPGLSQAEVQQICTIKNDADKQ
ncbi:MAG TPA: DUF4907 domain-containing protein [Flavisolibacter sp.]|nr:DUF4907 domain-containing protein [Flavisolibacter sp.]